MKILISGANTAGTLYNLANGLTALGHDVSSLSIGGGGFYRHHFSLSISPDTLVAARTATDITPSAAFYSLAEEFELFIFNSGITLLPGMRDLPILRRLGKKIIVRNTGSCTRFLYPGSLLWNHAGAPFSLSQEELRELACPAADWNSISSYFAPITYAYHLAPKLYKECMCALYADAVTNGPAHSSLSFAPFFAAINTFDPEGINAYIPGRSKPVILHAPSREAFKGTADIMASLEELRTEGLDFTLVRPQKLPNHELRKLLHHADIVIDELACGGHGILANEAMASGCLVLGANSPTVSPLPLHRPVVPINRQNLKEQIRRAVRDLAFRRRVAEAGIDYVNAVHRPPAAAAYLLSCLERGLHRDADYYPTLFLDNPYRPDYAGWIRQSRARLTTPDGTCPMVERQDEIPPFLRALLAKSLFRTGVHPQTDMQKFRCSGYIDNLQEQFLPRWDTARLRQANPWLWMGESAGRGLPVHAALSFAELANPS